MSALLHEPIHIAVISGRNVRFFAPPNGAREFPWVSIDDLHNAVAMDRRMRRIFLSMADHRPGSRVVKTPHGLTRIAPHVVAEGLIAAWVELGRAPAGLDIGYRIGAVQAMNRLLPDITMAELMAYARDASQANGGAE